MTVGWDSELDQFGMSTGRMAPFKTLASQFHVFFGFLHVWSKDVGPPCLVTFFDMEGP